MSIEAMRLALDALQDPWKSGPDGVASAITVLRAAIEQAEKREGWMPRAVLFENGEPIAHRELTEQKPVAWMYDFLNSDNRDEVIRDWMTQDYADIKREHGFNVRPLYTAPRQEQYDQTSLELCNECGWRALIPGEGCLTCARQKAKPVAFVDQRIHGWPDCFVMEPDPPHTVPLYTAPRQWVELTDDEARALVNCATFGDKTNWQALVYMVDAKLKEKNRDQ